MGQRRRWVSGCVGLAVTALASLGSPPAARADPATPAQVQTIIIPAPNGEIPSAWLSYSGPPRADVLLPAGYDPHRPYPLLVLLHGLGNDYDSYVEDGTTSLLAQTGAIVVTPEGGDGWYTDWWNGGRRGGPDWETYELDQVIPTILAHYPILPQRRYHAIAGVSMGGLGAVYLGGRLPGFFGSVATLSGFVDPGYLAPVVAPAMGIVSDAAADGDHHVDPVAGPPSGFYFQGHNPVDLVANLADTRVLAASGTGIPSPAGIASLSQGDLTEILEGSLAEGPIIYPMNQLYHAALTRAGVDVTYEVQAGGHDIPDFDNELEAMIAWGLFAPVPTDPTAWTNTTVAMDGDLWGVTYQFAQPPDRLVHLHRSGMVLSISAAGSSVTLTTPSGCAIHTPTPTTVNLTAACS